MQRLGEAEPESQGQMGDAAGPPRRKMPREKKVQREEDRCAWKRGRGGVQVTV